MSLASKYNYNTFQHLPEDVYEAELFPVSWSDFRTGFLVVSVVVLAIIGAISLCFPALLYTKDDGGLSLPRIEINSFSVTGFNLSTNQVRGNWDFEFVAVNFNHDDKMAFELQHINVSLLLKNKVPVYLTVLEPFELGPESFKTHIIGKISGSSEFLDDISTKAIANEITTNGVVKFDVKLVSSVKNKYLGVGWLKAYCDNMELYIIPDAGIGKMLSGTVDCNVKLT